jgi:hypothetical protein
MLFEKKEHDHGFDKEMKERQETNLREMNSPRGFFMGIGHF